MLLQCAAHFEIIFWLKSSDDPYQYRKSPNKLIWAYKTRESSAAEK